MFFLRESLDKIHPLQRIEPSVAWINDEWNFEVGSVTHVLRANKVQIKQYGKKVSRLEFGIKRGKKVSKKLTGVSNMRKYIATIVAAIQKMHEDPTGKLKMRGDGLIITMDSDIFEKRGAIFRRILKLKLKKLYKIHNSYFDLPDDEDRKAIYIWKKERSFSSVFSNLDVEDDSDEEPSFFQQDPVIKTKKTKEIEPDIEKITSDEPEVIPDPVRNTAENSKEPFIQKQARAKKEASFILKEKKVNISSYMKIAVAYAFFHNSYGEGRWAKKTSLDTSSVNITKDDVVEYIKKRGNFTNELAIGLPSSKECLIALNLNGIQTDHVYDLIKDRHPSSYFFKDLRKMGIDTDLLRDKIPKTRIENVSMNEIVDICINAKSFLKERGFETSSGADTPYDRKQREDIYANKTLSTVIRTADLSTQDIIDIFNSALASVDSIQIENLNPFKFEESYKGSKTVKELRYDYSDDPNIEALKEISGALDKIFEEDREKYYELQDRLPYFMQDMFTEDEEFFEVSFISNWTLSGGSSAQILGHEVFHDFKVNDELGDFYNEENVYSADFREKCRYRKERLNGHLAGLYEKNQQYYKDKYKKKYDTKMIKLYRGVGVKTVDSYIPGSLESWTTNVSTAKKFANMMSRRNEDYTILVAEVPIKDIFGSWDSFIETWPGEENLKGKKEYIVMGGTFATTPIYKYDTDRKETIKQLNTFKEWVEVNEAKINKEKSIKIVTPSMKGFKNTLNSGKTALGNDPKENEVRKNEKKVDK